VAAFVFIDDCRSHSFKADLLPVNMNEEPFSETARKRDAFARPQMVPPIEERGGNVETVLRGAREFA
jgi:hypothetical protein